MFGQLMIAFGRIAATELRGALKSILANLEFLGGDEASSGEPLYGVPGHFCRPMPPVEPEDATGLKPEGHCEVVAVRVGDEVIPLAYRDLRLNSQVNPDEGELGLAHYGGGFISLKWNTDEDGTNIMLYASRKDSSGTPIKASAISLDSTDGNQHICLMHEYGQSITLTKDGGVILANKAGDAYLEVNDDGCTFNGNTAMKGALRELTCGNPTSAEGLMMSTDLLSWITQVNACLAQIAGAAQPGGGLTGITFPSATPKASTIAKASEQAV